MNEISFLLFKYNLRPLFEILSQEVNEYNFDDNDWQAIEFGLEKTSDTENIWYDYSLTVKKTVITVKICQDFDNSDIIFVKILK